MKHVLTILLLLPLALTACGDDNEITLNGSEIGLELMEGACIALLDCGAFPADEYEICVDAGVQGFCSTFSDCDAQFTLQRDQWNACVDAMYGLSCAALDPIILPAECAIIDEL